MRNTAALLSILKKTIKLLRLIIDHAFALTQNDINLSLEFI